MSDWTFAAFYLTMVWLFSIAMHVMLNNNLPLVVCIPCQVVGAAVFMIVLFVRLVRNRGL